MPNEPFPIFPDFVLTLRDDLSKKVGLDPPPLKWSDLNYVF